MTIGQTAGFTANHALLAGNPKARETENRFRALIDGIGAAMGEPSKEQETLSSSELLSSPQRLNGDYISSLLDGNPTALSRSSKPFGAAANSGQNGTIDRTSRLYEQALELESYMVKIMLSSMKNTVQKSEFSGSDSFAGNMYDDMLYDELSRTVTRSAGFGLADQVYLQLSGNR